MDGYRADPRLILRRIRTYSANPTKGVKRFNAAIYASFGLLALSLVLSIATTALWLSLATAVQVAVTLAYFGWSIWHAMKELQAEAAAGIPIDPPTAKETAACIIWGTAFLLLICDAAVGYIVPQLDPLRVLLFSALVWFLVILLAALWNRLHRPRQAAGG